jgi:hypothetical protein
VLPTFERRLGTVGCTVRGGGKKLGRKARLVRIKRKGKGREGVKGSSGEAWRGRACAGRQAGRRWGPAPL